VLELFSSLLSGRGRECGKLKPRHNKKDKKGMGRRKVATIVNNFKKRLLACIACIYKKTLVFVLMLDCVYVTSSCVFSSLERSGMGASFSHSSCMKLYSSSVTETLYGVGFSNRR